MQLDRKKIEDYDLKITVQGQPLSLTGA